MCDLVGLDPYWSSGWSEASIGGGSIDLFVDWSGFKTVELLELQTHTPFGCLRTDEFSRGGIRGCYWSAPRHVTTLCCTPPPRPRRSHAPHPRRRRWRGYPTAVHSPESCPARAHKRLKTSHQTEIQRCVP